MSDKASTKIEDLQDEHEHEIASKILEDLGHTNDLEEHEVIEAKPVHSDNLTTQLWKEYKSPAIILLTVSVISNKAVVDFISRIPALSSLAENSFALSGIIGLIVSIIYIILIKVVKV